MIFVKWKLDSLYKKKKILSTKIKYMVNNTFLIYETKTEKTKGIFLDGKTKSAYYKS